MSGGAFGQGGIQYLAGQVEADYLDNLDHDLIAPERQRINWQLDVTNPLEKWGDSRIRSLLRIWRERRKDEKKDTLKDELDEFGERLSNLPDHEQETVEEALLGLTNVERLTKERFKTIGRDVIKAWEKGRLRNLIDDMAQMEDMEEGDLLDILLEAKVLNALQTAEAVLAKYQTIIGLRERVRQNELEDKVRNYIADNPWLVSPRWETFEKEKSVRKLTKNAAEEANLDDLEGYEKRTDLSLSSGRMLLIIEFMRPGKPLDRDHINRFQEYVDIIRDKIEVNTENRFKDVIGYLIADELSEEPGLDRVIQRIEGDDMFAMEWGTLIGKAEKRWASFFHALVDRAPEDQRLQDLERRFTKLYESARQQSGGRDAQHDF